MKSTEPCEHCGSSHSGQCPRIKAIEYYQNGNIKRIEYKTAADWGPQVSFPSPCTTNKPPPNYIPIPTT